MKRFLLFLFASLLLSLNVKADEGMWLLPMLNKMNIKDMKSKGFKLSASDIYDINKNSLKDAIVIFGGGCTGEIVSPDGLLFTNHHCGYGAIQKLSSVENDYLKYGFWAMDRKEEIPAPGLTVTFIRHIEDVTDKVLKNVTLETPYAERENEVQEAMKNIVAEYKEEERFKGMSLNVNQFFGGNQYFMFATEEYTDIRLVGTPPSSIGKFGGDTDNWMWPRHTGDFSVFRVYADKDGKPASYSKDNVPYKAPAHLKISLKGFKEGDFAMIMGFPGSTNRYMTSYEIDQVLEQDNPNRILIRGIRQEILKKAMNSSDEVRIKYASKYAGSSNYWKNSIGMSRGLQKLAVKGQKQRQEDSFRRWVSSSGENKHYAPALDIIKEAVEGRRKSGHISQYLSETLLRSVEIIRASDMASLMNDGADKDNIVKAGESFYKDYDTSLDKDVAKAMFALLKDNFNTEELPDIFNKIETDFNGDTDKYVDYLYEYSVFSDRERFTGYLEKGDFSAVENDPAVVLRNSVREAVKKYNEEKAPYDKMFKEGHMLYVAGLLEMEKDAMHYPDANFTIRLTYGNILPYSPADAVEYNYYTTLSGVIAKEDPLSTEFVVPEKLKELYLNKDFGRYAYKGDIPVGFISNNDITGGNSGSPVMNAKGELLGLAFDGNWEAMSGDIAFEPELQRCINVDIRYVLFIIDKFAGAGHILDELTIIE